MPAKKKLKQAQDEADADAKQRKLSFGLGLQGGKLHASLSTSKSDTVGESKAVGKHIARPAHKPQPLVVDSADLEVRTWLNGNVAKLVRQFEDVESNARMIQCRNVVNDMIDRLEASPPTKETFEGLKPKRVSYAPKVKREVVGLIEKEMAETGSSKAEALAKLNKVPGFDKVTSTMTRKWSTPGASKKMGRPVNQDFEEQVLAQLV